MKAQTRASFAAKQEHEERQKDDKPAARMALISPLDPGLSFSRCLYSSSAVRMVVQGSPTLRVGVSNLLRHPLLLPVLQRMVLTEAGLMHGH